MSGFSLDIAAGLSFPFLFFGGPLATGWFVTGFSASPSRLDRNPLPTTAMRVPSFPQKSRPFFWLLLYSLLVIKKKTKVNFLATTEIVQMCVFSRVFFPPATRLPSFTELTVFVRDWLLGFDIPLIFLKNGALLGCFLSCPRYFVRGKSFLLDGLVHRCSTISTDSFMLDLVWWNFTVS